MYAYWYKDKWRTDGNDLIRIIDKDCIEKYNELKKKKPDAVVKLNKMNDHSSTVMRNFKEYTKTMDDSSIEFNTRIIFSDEVPKREDYSTTQLSYYPIKGETPAFDKMFNLLYEKSELDKILWFIGATLTGSIKNIQKFLFLYGGKGSGKGTILKVLKMMFEGYYSDIDLQKLTGGGDFATSGIKETQLLIDDDSNIYSIKNDTNLLKLSAHEPLIVNNKYQSMYPITFKGLLVAASNQPFKVRNVDSGIIRRAVVASPTEITHSYEEYKDLMSRIPFEIPYIAQKAIDVFKRLGSGYYQDYVPVSMMDSTDIFFSFMKENVVSLGETCTLKTASELYKLYLEDIDFDTKGYKRTAKNELKRYYKKFYEQKKIGGENVKNVYMELKMKDILLEGKTDNDFISEPEELDEESLIREFALGEMKSSFDEVAATYPAQLANKEGTPKVPWDKVTTTLSQIPTNELHYVRVPSNHIVIDFDIKTDTGDKSLYLNLKAAKNFPDTYLELSKSGKGVHLHYIYDGDVGKLKSVYDDGIEIKFFNGKSSLRRKLSLCNNKEITHISTGLPEKEAGTGLYKDIEVIAWNEHKMRKAIKGNLEKRYHDSTKPSVDFIVKIFDDAQKAGVKYDLRDMRQDILAFAANSSNQSEYCIGAISKINYCTIENDDSADIQKQASKLFYDNEELYFYDIEVFSNLFIVAWKRYGSKETTKWINPTREQIASLVEKPLVGFNNRRYDNHVIYAALLGENNLTLYRQSLRIINDKNAGSGMYSGAYELSYTDIYDYCNAGNKMSLKKWEVKLGIKHDEYELPWDQPVPEDKWERAAEYCGHDVEATEAVFNATQGDYRARKILATLSGLSMNATTNQHTAAIIFEGKPKKETDNELVYTDLSKMFPGYKYSFGKSEYRDELPGEGGYVYAEPGVYKDVAILDIASMHPNSAIQLNIFGKYTKNLEQILHARILIKHKEYDKAKDLFDGKIAQFLGSPEEAKDLSNGLKTAINAVYGLTSAKFENQFRHKDNIDNIVAKRGALFMINLKLEVQYKGYTVAHVKTDCIKIPNADKKIIDFVMAYGKKYGYTFEHEATYKRMALVNKSTLVFQDQDDNWDAVGAQFQEPYVFKTLFSKEPIVSKDFFVTKEVKNASIFLGDTFIGRLAEVYASLTGDSLFRVKDDKKGYISGTKGRRWKLSNEFTDKHDIDISYYDSLVEDAKSAIRKVGDISIMIEEDKIEPELIDGKPNPNYIPF